MQAIAAACGVKKALKLHVATFDPTKETGIRNYVEITNNQHAPHCGLLADSSAWRHPCRSIINKCKWRGHLEHPLNNDAQSDLPHTSPEVATQDTLSAPVPRTVTTPHRDRKAGIIVRRSQQCCWLDGALHNIQHPVCSICQHWGNHTVLCWGLGYTSYPSFTWKPKPAFEFAVNLTKLK